MPIIALSSVMKVSSYHNDVRAPVRLWISKLALKVHHRLPQGRRNATERNATQRNGTQRNVGMQCRRNSERFSSKSINSSPPRSLSGTTVQIRIGVPRHLYSVHLNWFQGQCGFARYSPLRWEVIITDSPN